MTQPRITTAPISSTQYAPLVALGFWVRHYDLWAPIRSRVSFSQPTHTAHPVEALLDLAVGLLAGCAVVAQVNTTIRTDPFLAQAWGRRQFAEQSTIARVLDACASPQIAQWRCANEATLRWIGRVFAHPFAEDWLRLDIDLTALEASATAEGSTKGYVPRKKTRPADNSAGSVPSSPAKSCAPPCFQGRKPVPRRSRRWCWKSNGSGRSRWPNASARCCARMLGLGRMATSAGYCPAATNCWSRGFRANGPPPTPGGCARGRNCGPMLPGSRGRRAR